MSWFQLDTSGHVPSPHGVVFWFDLDAFTQGYIEALLSSVVGVDPSDGLPRGAGFADLAPETLAQIIEDCAARLRHHPSEAEGFGLRRGGDPVRDNGHRFWAWRQAGQCKNFPPLTLTLGDDGKVYAAPAQGSAQ